MRVRAARALRAAAGRRVAGFLPPPPGFQDMAGDFHFSGMLLNSMGWGFVAGESSRLGRVGQGGRGIRPVHPELVDG